MKNLPTYEHEGKMKRFASFFLLFFLFRLSSFPFSFFLGATLLFFGCSRGGDRPYRPPVDPPLVGPAGDCNTLDITKDSVHNNRQKLSRKRLLQ